MSDHPASQPSNQTRIRQDGDDRHALRENGSWPTSSSTLVLWTLSCWGSLPQGQPPGYPPEGTVGRKRKPPGLKPACGERGVPISPTLLGSAQGLGGIGPLQMPLVSHKSLPPALGAVSRPQGTGQTGWNPVGQPVEARKARSPSERPGAAPKGTRRNRVALSLGKGASRARPRGAPRSGLCFTQAACPGGLSVAERDRETETERLGDREAGRQSELGAVTVRL